MFRRVFSVLQATELCYEFATLKKKFSIQTRTFVRRPESIGRRLISDNLIFHLATSVSASNRVTDHG